MTVAMKSSNFAQPAPNSIPLELSPYPCHEIRASRSYPGWWSREKQLLGQPPKLQGNFKVCFFLIKSPFWGEFYSIFLSHHEINHPPTVRSTRQILSITRGFRIPPLSQQVLNQGVSELNLDTSTCTIQIYLRLMISHQFGHHPKFSWEFPELNQNDSYLSRFKILNRPSFNGKLQTTTDMKLDEANLIEPVFSKILGFSCSQVANQSDVSGIASCYKTRKECHERLE